MLSHVNNTEFGGGGPKGKTQLGRNWYRWEENITFDLKEIESNGVDMINLATERDKWHTLVNMSWKIGFYKRQDIS
jgi:hypothetical protein